MGVWFAQFSPSLSDVNFSSALSASVRCPERGPDEEEREEVKKKAFTFREIKIKLGIYFTNYMSNPTKCVVTY